MVTSNSAVFAQLFAKQVKDVSQIFMVDIVRHVLFV